jgi:DNA-binding LytR/AlgR family response regulator
MKISIVDDSKSDRLLAKKWTQTYFSERTNQLNIAPIFHEFDSGESFLESGEVCSCELLILDIYMQKLTGLDVAKRVLALNKSCNIILFTSSEDHQLDGYSIHAIGYVMKPVDQHINALYRALDYVVEKMELDKAHICANTAFGSQRLYFRNISHIDCINRIVNIHLTGQTLEIYGKYKDYQNAFLSDSRFIECNRNLIVNLDYVDSIKDDDFILTTGDCIPISRRKKVTTLEYYMTYFINRIG